MRSRHDLKGVSRFYTEKSHRLMLKVRLFVLILTSPIWLPLFLLTIAAYKLEDLLDYLDKVLQKVLDKVIPQIK
ncbi:hypothetical protein ABMB67_001584 [Halalkalibacter oceani]